MKQIFLVEDDRGIRELLEFILVSQNYQVESFPTAGDFKRTIPYSHPDLILMDIMLPDGNGMDMCNDLGSEMETRNIPVVLMSAHADAHSFKNSCARDFIAKPFDVEDLLVRIEKQLA